MIIRVSEAHLRTGVQEEFLALLRDLVAGFPAQHPGLLHHEILVDTTDPRRVQYVSTWADEAALAGYAGADWRFDAVTFPGEERFLERPLTLRHFASVDVGGAPR